MKRKEVASLLVSSIAITGGIFSAGLTAGATTAAPLIISEGLKAFGSLGGGFVGNVFNKYFIENHPQDDVLKNGDLTRAIGNAIFRLCGEFSKYPKYQKDHKCLEKLAQTELEIWENLILGGEYVEGKGLVLTDIDLNDISADKSVQFFDSQAEKFDEIKTLTPQSWQNILKTLCEKRNCKLSTDTAEELSEHLCNNFAKALREVLKDDFNKDGKAFASMQFRLLSEILFYTKQNSELSDSILPIVIEILKKVDDINQNAPKNYSLENKANWEKIFTDFDSFIEIQKKTYENTEEIKADVKKILENQQNQTARKYSKPKGLINIPEKGMKFFMEQGTVLGDLETQLNDEHIACLKGKPGLGKTTNAEEFGRRQVGNYELVVFIKSAEQIIETEITKFADKYAPELQTISVVEREQMLFEKKLEYFKSFFEDSTLWDGEKRGWLLIFDNVEKKEHLREYFPNQNNGDILYTCNDDLYLNERCDVQINEFTQEEAELFLYKRSNALKDAKREEIPPDILTEIRKILNDFDRLPFVINKFRVYLSEVQISYAEFYQDLKNNEQRYFELPASSDKYDFKNEIIAFSTLFEKIKPKENQSKDDQIISRLAVALLNISAFCSADQIPEEMLKDTLFRLVETSETTLSNAILFAEAFRKLQRFDLLNSRTEIFEYLEKRETPEIVYTPYQKEETVYQSHRTIQKIVKLNLEKEAQKEILNEIVIVFRGFLHKPDLENWKIYEKYLSNAENIIQEAQKLEFATEGLGFICNSFGFYQRQLAQYEKAIQFYEEAIKIDEQTIGKEHPYYAISLNNLAVVYRSQGRYAEAIEKFEEAIKIDEQTIGKEHPHYAIDLSNLATVYRSQGRYEEAIEKLEKAIKIGEKTIGKEHPDYAGRLNNLALVYYSQGRYDEAIEKYEEALKIDEQTIGKEHPEYATHLGNLALVYEAQGKYQEALDLFEEALRIDEKTLPENHPYTIQDRESVARCRAMLGK